MARTAATGLSTRRVPPWRLPASPAPRRAARLRRRARLRTSPSELHFVPGVACIRGHPEVAADHRVPLDAHALGRGREAEVVPPGTAVIEHQVGAPPPAAVGARVDPGRGRRARDKDMPRGRLGEQPAVAASWRRADLPEVRATVT